MLPQEREIDEFGIILIGALILFFGLTYFIISTQTRIIANVTNETLTIFSLPFIKLDTLNRTITLLEVQGSVYKSLFSEKQDSFPLKIDLKEVENIEKINLHFDSEKKLSKVYLVSDKRVFEIQKEITKELITPNSYILVKIEEIDYTFFVILGTAYILIILILYTLLKKYSQYNFEIKIAILSVSVVFFSLVLIFGNKKVVDNYNLKLEAIMKSFVEKSFEFKFLREKRNLTLYFELEKAIQTAPLKIILNDEILYFTKPFSNRINITKEVSLKESNILKISVEGEALYEIKNLKLIVGPARS
ncbi:MAG: hypothetical protein QXQ14_01425 [Candidatus Aenigmatarchaeota archaeon]